MMFRLPNYMHPKYNTIKRELTKKAQLLFGSYLCSWVSNKCTM